MKSVFYISILLLLLSACSGNADRERMQRIVEEWQGRQIELPDVMTDFLTGDTIDLSDADFTILTYVDSAGCTGCKMRLALWKAFLDDLVDVSDVDTKFVMVVNTHMENDLNETLSKYSFVYPLYRDSTNLIFLQNGLPNESKYQTFLLNKNLEVIALGSPVSTYEIESMYKDIISGGLVMSKSFDSVIQVSENFINLGELKQGEVASRQIKFANKGKKSVIVDNVSSSCDCIQLSFPTITIYPSEDTSASLIFKGDSVVGEFERTIKVSYENIEYPTMINVSGNIIY